MSTSHHLGLSHAPSPNVHGTFVPNKGAIKTGEMPRYTLPDPKIFLGFTGALDCDFFLSATVSERQQRCYGGGEPEHQEAGSRDSDNIDRIVVVVKVKAHGSLLHINAVTLLLPKQLPPGRPPRRA
jgi:hypothetical protein